MKGKYFALFFLVIIFVPISYLETSTNQSLSEEAPFLIGDSESKGVSAMAEATEEEDQLNSLPVLENKLINQEYIDGYYVETYREYEVYKDGKGNIEKTVPTSNYDYIRYKVNE